MKTIMDSSNNTWSSDGTTPIHGALIEQPCEGFLSFLDICNKFLDFPVSNKNFGRPKSQRRSAMKSAWKLKELNVEFLDIL